MHAINGLAAFDGPAALYKATTRMCTNVLRSCPRQDQRPRALQASLDGGSAARVHPYSASYSRTPIRAVIGGADGGKSLEGETLVVGGWVKSGREQGGGAFYFIQLNDGSIFTDIQVRAHVAHTPRAACGRSAFIAKHR